ncbi:MAG TPA: hypothetical protein VKH34_05890 [Vicinamibacterales bacterium]|nr:hypothetical protein [Vicinamibacterales bacterium]
MSYRASGAAACAPSTRWIEQARITEQLQKEMQKRERLRRYHSPAVVNKIN